MTCVMRAADSRRRAPRTSLATPPALAYASLVCFPVRRFVMMRTVSAVAKMGASAEITSVSFHDVTKPRMSPVRS